MGKDTEINSLKKIKSSEVFSMPLAPTVVVE